MFEHSLIDLESRQRPRRRWISLPIAVGLHLAGITAFALASYWSVDKVAEPKIVDIFFVQEPVPLLAGGGGGQKPTVKPTETKEQEKPPTQEQTVQPNIDNIPEKPPTPTVTVDSVVPTADSSHDGPLFSDSKPCAGCPPGPGYGNHPVGPTIGSESDSQPLTFSIGSNMTRPEIVHQVQPRYTELARRSGAQGTVIVEAIIDEQGRVTNVRVLRGQPLGLDQAAVEAIQQWRFKPATLADKPVKVFYTLTVNFTIQR